MKWSVIAVCLVTQFALLACSRGEEAKSLDLNSASGNTRTSRGSQGDADDWLEYRDEIDGFTFRYPQTWTLEQASRSSTMIRADLVMDDTTGLQVRVYRDVEQGFEDFVEDYLRLFVDDMTGHWGGEILLEEPLIDAGRSGGRASAAAVFRRQDRSQWMLKQYLWSRGDLVVAFQAGTPLGERSTTEPVLDEIAGTFGFVN